MPRLVEILLPVVENGGRSFASLAAEVRDELVARFGGATAFTRAPAEGFWDGGDGAVRDDVVVIEVMVDMLDRAWWRSYRRALEQRFGQQRIVIRQHAVECL